MILATLSTSNFDFTALGTDQGHAERIMRGAWAEHRRQTGAWLTWADLADDVNYTEIHLGAALRDGSLINAGVLP